MYISSAYPSRLPARRPPVLYRRSRGVGDYTLPTSTQIVGGATAGAETGAATAMSSGSNVAGAVAGGLLAVAPFTGPAAPFVAAAGAIVALAAKIFAGCGQTCVLATQYADQAGNGFDQILSLYYAQPVRTVSMQQAALQAVQQITSWLQQACSNPTLGAAGQRCISERLTPTGSPPGCVTGYGAPMTAGDPGYASGQGCNVYTYYINRIAGDTAVVPDSAVVASSSAAIAAAPGAVPTQSVLGQNFLVPASVSPAGVASPATIAGVPIQNLLLPAALLAGLYLATR